MKCRKVSIQGSSKARESEPTDLESICRHGVAEAETANPSRRVDLTLEGDPRGVWDPDRLAQVVSNLLGNALDYSPPEAPVTIAVRDRGESVVLEVHNEGAPIPTEKLAEIFEPFRRGEQASTNGRPSGLGLFITKLVAEAHGGSIEVKSAEDTGTTFTVSLPRRRASP